MRTRGAGVDVHVARHDDLFGRGNVLGVEERVDLLELPAAHLRRLTRPASGVGRLRVGSHHMHRRAIDVQFGIDEALVGPPVAAAGVLVDELLLADDRPLAQYGDTAVLRSGGRVGTTRGVPAALAPAHHRCPVRVLGGGVLCQRVRSCRTPPGAPRRRCPGRAMPSLSPSPGGPDASSGTGSCSSVLWPNCTDEGAG